MPIEHDRLENRIYMMRWHGHVTMNEVIASHDWSRGQATLHHETKYAHIIDSTDVEQYSYNLRGYLHVLLNNPDCAVIVFNNLSPAGRALATATVRLLPRMEIGLTTDLDAAVEEARALLQRKRPVTERP